MLKRIRLINYRCFEKSEISFKEVSIIVGNNNAGKSTLIEALRIVSEVAKKMKNTNYVSPPSELNLPISEKGFKVKYEALSIDLSKLVKNMREKQRTCREQ